MGSIVCSLEHCLDTILDVVVIKTGLVICEDDLIQILKEGFPDDRNFQNKTNDVIRIRSEEFDSYCWYARKRLGEIDQEMPRRIFIDPEMMQWAELGYDVIAILESIVDLMKEEHDPNNPIPINPTIILAKAITNNIAPEKLIRKVITSILENQKRSNTIFPAEQIIWDGGTDLCDLFKKDSKPKGNNGFIEQRFINYLHENPEKLQSMHWRNFERLTAEFFEREGFIVELGPGSKDGGIDLRIYHHSDEQPYIIVQCKRNQESNHVKIETVKAIYADVLDEGAGKGLIATTSRIAPGGKTLCSIRKYPIEFAENEVIKAWINKMKRR